jgi:hypothetical protein
MRWETYPFEFTGSKCWVSEYQVITRTSAAG